MKKLILLIAAVAVLSCTRAYEQSYPELRYDYESYTLPFNARSLPLTIFYDGPWKAEFSESWAVFNPSTGKGTTTIHLEIGQNDGSKREGKILLTSIDDGKSVEIPLLQKASPAFSIPVRLNADELMEKLPAEGKSYLSDEERTDYILGRAIGRCDNLEQNLQSSQILITSDENDRTNYLRIFDSQGHPRGIRLKFTSAENNTLQKGDVVRINLDGLKFSYTDNPFGITLNNILPTDIEVLKESDEPELLPYEKTIGSLDEKDLYNYVTLTGVEFSVKEGSFTNVREYDAIECWSNSGIPTGSTEAKPARRVKDGAASLIYDAQGDAIYMIVNMKCDWRRQGNVPKGVGSISGIIVHNLLPRYGKNGNVGTFSIRPLSREDIDIPEQESSSWKNLASWVLSEQTDYLSTYRWNRSATPGGYSLGPSSENTPRPDFVLNMLCATAEIEGADAVLYNENRTQYKGWNANLSKKPITVAHGYKSIDVSSPGGKNPTFDQSKFSAVALAGSPQGYYIWNEEGEWTGETRGIVTEFSSLGASGNQAAVSFSIAAGHMDTSSIMGVSTDSWTYCSSWPAFWKVEYRTKDAPDGEWSPYVRMKNAIRGAEAEEFEMKSVPWAMGTSPWGRPVSPYSQSTSGGLWTGDDWGFGHVRHRFILPSDALGKALVQVRISPSSTLIATHNTGGSSTTNLGKTQTAAQVHIRSSIDLDVRPLIYVEDYQIEYR